MTTTNVDDAIILPQSQGTGLSGEESVIDAAINGVLNRYVGGEYVSSTYSTGLAFQNHNASNDTVEVGPGIVFIKDNSTSTSSERGSGGNPQAESSTTSGYDTELPEGHTYAVLFPTATQISVSDSTLNEVYIDIDDVTANNSVNLEHDGSSTANPGNTSLKIGETNPDDASVDTRANDDPTFDSLIVNGTTDTDALDADTISTNTISTNYIIDATEYATLQDALNAADNNNIPIVVSPPKTYSLSSTLEIPDGVALTSLKDGSAVSSKRVILDGDSGVDPVITSKSKRGTDIDINGITILPDSSEDAFNGDVTQGKLSHNELFGDIVISSDDAANSEGAFIFANNMRGNDITADSGVDSTVLITGNRRVGTVTSNNGTEGTNS